MSQTEVEVPQALFFEYDKTGFPRRVTAEDGKPLHERKGFWATVIKCYPEKQSKLRHRVWLLKKESGHFMVWLEDTNASFLGSSTDAVLLYDDSGWSELMFELFKQKFVTRIEVHDLIMDTRIENDPEGAGGHWKRATRLVREEFNKSSGANIAEVAVILGVDLTREKLLLRPKHEAVKMPRNTKPPM